MAGTILKAALLSVGASALLAQQAVLTEQETLGRVGGLVIDVATQEPLAKVEVKLEGSGGDNGFAGKTDIEGRFAIENVAPGRYSFRLTRNQYVQTGVRSSSSLPQDGILTVSPGELIDNLVLGMQPAAVITGRVVDEDGEPFEGLTVEAFGFLYWDGNREPRVRGSGMSDDRGEYRIYGLYPGDYYLRVNTHPFLTRRSAFDEVAPGYADTYYPNGHDESQARSLRVTGEAETSGIDFRMTPTRTFDVSGWVIDGVTGRPITDATAFLVDRSRTGIQFPISGRLIRVRDGDGWFRAENVIAGSYRLEVIVTSPDRTRSTAYYDFDLSDRSFHDVRIETRSTFSVPLVVTIEGESDRHLSPSAISLEPMGPYSGFRASGARFAENGEPQFLFVAADLYRIRVNNIGDLYLKSARYGGRDALNEFVRVEEGGGAFEVVLSANGARLEGQIARNGEGVSGVQVVVVPEDRQRGYLYKSAVTDQNGAFVLTAIAPGRYKVFAWERIEVSAWTDARVLAEFEDQGVSVEVKEGDAKRVTPKLIGAKD